MLLVLTTATLVTTALAQYAGPATGHVGQPRPNARRSDGMGPDLIRDTVRRAVGLDRLQSLRARRRLSH